MKVKQITDFLESVAPISSQESYDNSGLIVGDPNMEISKALVCLDCTELIIDEAVKTGCNFVIAHHPIIFKGLRKIIGQDYVSRTVIKAIKNEIAIYASHTNFDNYRYGVNCEIGERLGLKSIEILSPKNKVLTKLICYVPTDKTEEVAKSMFDAGAGNIGNYSECSFKTLGEGTFKPGLSTNPATGSVGEQSRVEEHKLEVIVSNHKLESVLKAMRSAHPYEEVAHEMYSILNENQSEGSGMIGELDNSMDELSFLGFVKETFNCGVIRHTDLRGKKVKRIAFCGGAGSFLLNEAKRKGVDVFISSDFKYHEFFDAENEVIIADIGHFESEQFTSQRIASILTKKFPKFALHLTEVNTNPINYF